jgi:membrane fusion protein, multidrug efflux system
MKLILTLGLLFISFCVVAAQNDQIAELTPQPYATNITRIGKLAFKHTVNLTFKSTGYVSKLKVDAGEVFKRGQVLASIETTELVEDKNSKFAQLIQAKRDVKRLTELLKRELSAQQALDDAKTRVEMARAAYQVAYYNLQKAQIIAPFDGIVLTRTAQVSELLGARQAVLTVAALQDNWIVRVALTEAELGQLELQQPVVVNTSHLGQLNGIVSKIPAFANTGNGLFTIEVTLVNFVYQPGVIAGQMATVEISASSEQQVYQVPSSALIGMNPFGKAIVLVQNEQRMFAQATFDVVHLDEQYVYLAAKDNLSSIRLVLQGWQQLLAKGQ